MPRTRERYSILFYRWMIIQQSHVFLQPARYHIDAWDEMMMDRDARLTGHRRGQKVCSMLSMSLCSPMLNIRLYISVRSYTSWRVRDIHRLAHRTGEIDHNACIITSLNSRSLFVWTRPVVNYLLMVLTKPIGLDRTFRPSPPRVLSYPQTRISCPARPCINYRAAVHNLAHSQRRYRMKV